jgi:chemotaxis protein MotA
VKKLDIATLIGLLLAVGGILVGNALEGGKVSSILQPTAALIVFGGTLGAVFVTYPMPIVLRGFKAAAQIFGNRSSDARGLLDEIVRYAQKARKEGIISLEAEVRNASDPFLKRAILMAIDGVDSKTMHETLDLELTEMNEQGELSAKVYEAAGGYAPTIGILGAVLGLIHVMQNLSDVSKVGEGIAVAFVATIYGVGSANILFLPAGGKLKVKHREEMVLREMMMHGAIAIQEGQNPKLIEDKLSAFLQEKRKAAEDEDKGKKAAPRAAA